MIDLTPYCWTLRRRGQKDLLLSWYCSEDAADVLVEDLRGLGLCSAKRVSKHCVQVENPKYAVKWCLMCYPPDHPIYVAAAFAWELLVLQKAGRTSSAREVAELDQRLAALVELCCAGEPSPDWNYPGSLPIA